MAKYKVGDKVRVKKTATCECSISWNNNGKMDHWRGQIMTIRSLLNETGYKMVEDINENGGGWRWHEYWLEPITDFTKSDLKTGMVVKLRDGDFYLVYGERLFSDYGYREIDNYNEDLTHTFGGDRCDIVEVYDVNNYASVLKDILDHPGTLIWSREPNEREISSEEAFKILKEHYGCDVKIKE